MTTLKVINFDPKLHKDQVLKIFKSHSNVFPKREIAMLKRGVENPSQKEICKLVAVLDKKVLGYVEVIKPEDSKSSWELNWLAVSKKYQRKGIGILLINTIEKTISDLQGSQLFIHTCDCKEERPARELYRKMGYKKIALLPDYFAPGYSRVVFIKKFEIQNKTG